MDKEMVGDQAGEAAADLDPNASQDDEELGVGALCADDLIPDRALKQGDEDRFNHVALARRVAELATSAEPPLNVGLFGAWGSGKSSLASLIRERVAQSDAGFIYYDAWKYGGKALRRNFISRAATELELSDSEFHRGLYETKRSAEFKPDSLKGISWAITWRFAATFLALLALFALAAGAASLLTARDFLGEIRQAIPGFIQAGTLAAFVLAAAKVIFDHGQVEVEQSAPSDDEEFISTFQDLILKAQTEPEKPGWFRAWWEPRWESFPANPPQKKVESGGRPFDRLIFFIDELDRCGEEDVVETLIAVRTFLDEEHCVFIVAADRDVLETALNRHLKQATPTNADNPYYTTAGAFLDKVFGHQIAVPPLRGRRLTRFARDLVRDKGGLWNELIEAKDSATLEAVVYSLVPSHVRSPRRVKVLLNNFATNARIAEARQIDWIERAEEIAKLTALQTEFPALAEDLPLEPRLPRFLLAPDSAEIPDRSGYLVNRHRLDEDGANDETQDPDAYLAESDSGTSDQDASESQQSARRREMRRRHRAQLHRYLERTIGINLQRDLLYLEAAGAAVGLADPELGELIEEDGPEHPERVLDVIRGHPVDEQIAASRLLADIAQDTISVEQSNVMSVLMALVVDLGDDLSDQAALEIANSLKISSHDSRLPAGYLPGALAIALRTNDHGFASRLGHEEELWSDPDRVSGVARLYAQLPTELRERLREALNSSVSEGAAPLVSALKELPERQASDVLEETRDALEAHLGAESVDQEERRALADRLLDAALEVEQPRPLLLGKVTEQLVNVSTQPTYLAMASHGDTIVAHLSNDHDVNEFVIGAWQQAESDDWKAWAGRFRPDEQPYSGGHAKIFDLLIHLFGSWSILGDSQQEEIADQLKLLVPYAAAESGSESDGMTSLIAVLDDLFSDHAWAVDSGAREGRERLHVAVELLFDLDPDVARMLHKLLASDLIHALSQSPGAELPAGSLEALRGAELMGPALEDESIPAIAAAIPAIDADLDPDRASAEISVRAVLTGEARKRGLDWKRQPFGVARGAAQAVARTRGVDYDDAIGHWLELAPTAELVAAVARELVPELDGATQKGLELWTSDAKRTQRTALTGALLRADEPASRWLEVVAAGDFNESGIAAVVVDLILDAENHERRLALATDAVAIGFQTRKAAQVLSNAVVTLLGKARPKSDVRVAAQLVRAIPSDHARAQAISNAFKRAVERNGARFSREEAEALRSRGVAVPKDGLGKKLRKLFNI